MFRFLNESEIDSIKYNFERLKVLLKLKLISENKQFAEKIYSENITFIEFFEIINIFRINQYSIEDIEASIGPKFMGKMKKILVDYNNEIIANTGDISKEIISIYFKNILFLHHFEEKMDCNFKILDKLIFDTLNRKYKIPLDLLKKIEKLINTSNNNEEEEDDCEIEFYDRFSLPVSEYFLDTISLLTQYFNIHSVGITKPELVYHPDKYLKYFNTEYDYLIDVILSSDDYNSIENIMEDELAYFNTFESEDDYLIYFEKEVDELLLHNLSILSSASNSCYSSYNYIDSCESVLNNSKKAIKWEFDGGIMEYGLNYKTINLILIMLGGF